MIKDNFFKFWYRYIFTNDAYYSLLGPEMSAKEIMNDISNHMGGVFEDICKEYVMKLAKKENLPFIPYQLGRWWGTNPYTKDQDDVDLLALDKSSKKAILIECKFTNKLVPYSEYEDLQNTAKGFTNIKDKQLWFISKSGYTSAVTKQAKKDSVILLTIKDLFNV